MYVKKIVRLSQLQQKPKVSTTKNITLFYDTAESAK